MARNERRRGRWSSRSEGRQPPSQTPGRDSNTVIPQQTQNRCTLTTWTTEQIRSSCTQEWTLLDMLEIPKNDECRGVTDGEPRKNTKCTKPRKPWMARPPRRGRNKLACLMHATIPSCLPLAVGLTDRNSSFAARNPAPLCLAFRCHGGQSVI